MPIHRRLPKRGFNNKFAKAYAVVNLGNIQKFIDAGKLDAKAPIDEAALVDAGLVRRKRDGVRVLAKGELTTKGVTIEATGASKGAIAAVEAAGGTLTLRAPEGPAKKSGKRAERKAEAAAKAGSRTQGKAEG